MESLANLDADYSFCIKPHSFSTLKNAEKCADPLHIHKFTMACSQLSDGPVLHKAIDTSSYLPPQCTACFIRMDEASVNLFYSAVGQLLCRTRSGSGASL